MVREDRLKPLLIGHDGPLDKLGHDLIAAANAAGGRDNITVILFTLEEVDAPVSAGGGATAASALDQDTREYNTFQGEAVAEPRQGVSRPQGHTRRRDESEARGATRASDEAEAEYRASGTVALSAVRPRAQPIEEGHPHAPPAGAAAQAAAVPLAGQADRRQLRHRPPGSLLARDAAGLLRRRRRIPRQRRHPLQGPSVRPPARDPALLGRSVTPA